MISISKTYIKTVNEIVSDMVEAEKALQLSSKDVDALMPSAVKNQAIRDAKSVYKKSKKQGTVPILRKPVCLWNNQNYTVKESTLEFPVLINGKSQRIGVKAIFNDYQKTLIEEAAKLGMLGITQKSGKWIAQIAVEDPELITVHTDIVMGVDLGLKVPAVAKISDGKVKFFGNGRMNKFFKRRFRAIRKKLGQMKNLEAIRKLSDKEQRWMKNLEAIGKLSDKEQRWMKNQDHKISREIVNFAIENHVAPSDLKNSRASDKRQRQAVKMKRICTPGHSIVWRATLSTRQF